MMNKSVQKIIIGFGAVWLLSLLGCAWPGGSVSYDPITVVINAPSDGATLYSIPQPNTNAGEVNDDLDLDLPGLQIDVEVSGTNIKYVAENPPVVSLTYTLDGQTSEPVTSVLGLGLTTTFSEFTIPDGAVNLTATIGSATGTLSLIVAGKPNCIFSSPVASSVTTPSITSESKTEYVDADDPYDPIETDITLSCERMQTDEYVALQVGGGEVLVGQVDASGSVAFTQVALGQGDNNLTATAATDATGEALLVASSSDDTSESSDSSALSTKSSTAVVTTGSSTSVTMKVETGYCLGGDSAGTRCGSDSECGEGGTCNPRCIANITPGDWSKLLYVDDMDFSSGGLQTNIAVTTDCPTNSTVTLKRMRSSDETSYEAAEPLAQSSVLSPDGQFSIFQFLQVYLKESQSAYDVLLVAEVTEEGATGRTGYSVPVRLWVDSIPPSRNEISLSDGTCYTTAQDIDTDLEGMHISAFGTYTGADDGSEVRIRTQVEGETASACTGDYDCSSCWLADQTTCEADNSCSWNSTTSSCSSILACRKGLCQVVTTVTSEAFSLSALPLPLGETVNVYILATDTAGNESNEEELSFQVYDSNPQISITSPSDGASFGVSDDADTSTSGFQTSVTLSMSGVPSSTTSGSLTISNSAPVSFTPDYSTTAASVSVEPTFEDGSYALAATVADACGTPATSDTVNITVLADVSDVTLRAYKSGTEVAQSESISDGVTTGASAIDLDITVGTSSTERTVSIAHTNAVTTESSGNTCSGTSVQELADQTVAASATGVLLANVSLSAGTNCFSVTSNDGVNQVSSVIVINLDNSAPTLTLSDPSAASPTITTDSSDTLPGFNYSVVVDLGSGDASAGTLTLSIGGFNSISQNVAAEATSVTFSDASLPTGTYSLTATFVDVFGNSSSSDALTVSVGSSSGPHVAITAPSGGGYVNDSTVGVGVKHIGANAPTSCQLFAWAASDSPSSSAVATEAWTGGVLGTQSISHDFGTDGTYQARVACTDGSTTGISQSVEFVVDSTPPAAVTFVNEDSGTAGALVFDTVPTYANTLTEDISSNAGLQHPVTVQVSNASGEETQGWKVVLSVTPDGGSATNYEYEFKESSTATSLQVLFGGVDFGSTDQDVVLSAVVSDQALNSSTATAVTMTVDLTAPVVSQSFPGSENLILTSFFDEWEDVESYIGLSFRYTVVGAKVDSSISFSLNPTPSQPTGKATRTYPETKTVSSAVSESFESSVVYLVDNSYAATVTAEDEAGNITSQVHAFSVFVNSPQLIWSTSLTPANDSTLNSDLDSSPGASGMQANFYQTSTGFAGGTSVKICSTGAPESAEACRWGSDGLGGTQNVGRVLAESTISGDASGGSAAFASVDFAEGAHVIHTEAIEADGYPDVASAFRSYTIDSVPPVVDTITLLENSTTNDGANAGLDSGILGLSTLDGTVSSTFLKTQVQVDVSGAEDGQSVTFYSDGDAVTSEGSTVIASGSATFYVLLPEGSQVLTASATDAAGNVSTESDSKTALVDITAPTGSVQAVGTVFNSDAGTVSGSTLLVSVTATDLSDTNLSGGACSNNLSCLSLSRYPDANGTSGQEVTDTTSTADMSGAASEAISDYALVAGLNYLKATLTDALGNSGTTAVQTYGADFIGPTLTLDIKLGGSLADTSSVCTSGSPCTVDVEDPDSYGDNVVFDFDGGDDVFRSSPDGSDLVLTLADCQNSDATIEDCSGGMSVSLFSKIVGASADHAQVDGSSFTASADIAQNAGDYSVLVDPGSACAPGSLTTCYRFDPGVIREVYVQATDVNNNTSTSNILYIQPNISGVLLTPTVLDSEGATTSTLSSSETNNLGQADNLNGASAPFQMNMQLAAEPTVGSSEVPYSAVLSLCATCDGSDDTALGTQLFGTPSAGVYSLSTAFSSIPSAGMSDGTSYTLTVTVNCGDAGSNAQCAQKEYSLAPDITAPRFYFDRPDLCALGVNFSSASYCDASASEDTCNDAGGNVASINTSTAAVWNRANDSGSTIGSFTISELVVHLSGVAENTDVDLKIGSTVLEDASQTAVQAGGCVGEVCTATFNSILVPSQAGTSSVDITVAVNDVAGNSAVGGTASGTCSDEEKIVALVDTVAPGAPGSLVACVGDSTGSGLGSKYQDDASCSTHCAAGESACSRRQGNVTLAWTSPDEDAASVGAVAEYHVAVVGLNIPYGVCQNSGNCLANSGTTCDEDADCPTGDTCEGTDACTGNSDCESGTTCVNEVTYTGCTDNEAFDDALLTGKLADNSTVAVFEGVDNATYSEWRTSPPYLGEVGESGAPTDDNTLTISGLYPHRDYCIGVMAVDDAGNKAVSVTQRMVQLYHSPNAPTVAYDSSAPVDDTLAQAMHSDEKTHAGDSAGAAVVNVGDIDNDSRDDFALSTQYLPAAFAEGFPDCTPQGAGEPGNADTNCVSGAYCKGDNTCWYRARVQLFLSSSGDLTTPDVIIEAPTLEDDTQPSFGAFGSFGRSIVGGNFDNSNQNDLVICSQLATVKDVTETTNVSQGGAVYIYLSGSGKTLDSDCLSNSANCAAPEETDCVDYECHFPSVKPDYTLVGNAENTKLCDKVLLSDIDDNNGDDLIIRREDTGGHLLVFDGQPSRFNSGYVVVDPATTAVDGDSNQATFKLTGRPTAGFSFPFDVTTADLNGDGAKELIVSDYQASHASGAGCTCCLTGATGYCGEVYVYASGMHSGSIDWSDVDTPPAEMETILRGNVTDTTGGWPVFGFSLFSVAAPRAQNTSNATDADWLFVRGRGVVYYGFSGSDSGLELDGCLADGSPATFKEMPQDGCANSSYRTLDTTDWSGSSMADLGKVARDFGQFDGHGGADFLFATGGGATSRAVLYSFDEHIDGFRRRVILHSDAEKMSNGAMVLDGYLGTSIKSLGLSSKEASDGSSLIYLFY